jgi:hypothetical protein
MRLVRVVIILIFLIWLSVPVEAQLGVAEFVEHVFKPVPDNQMTVQEMIHTGDIYKKQCEQCADLLLERDQELIKQETGNLVDTETIRTSTDPRGMFRYVNSDPDAAKYFDDMRRYCNMAEKYYNMALKETKEDDYKTQALIWDSAAGVYHTYGMSGAEQQCRNVSAVARDRAVVGSLIGRLFEPLPEWVALLGVIGGIFFIHRRMRTGK